MEVSIVPPIGAGQAPRGSPGGRQRWGGMGTAPLPGFLPLPDLFPLPHPGVAKAGGAVTLRVSRSRR